MKFLLFSAVAAVAFLSLWGWGWLVRRWVRLPGLSAPLTAAGGLGAVICLGGILNLGRVAVGPALDLIVLTGLVLAAVGWFRREDRGGVRPTAGALLAALPLLLTGWFLVRYLTPVAAFNYHDDLERYFAYPVRMLATGTLAGNPLGLIGADTLGAQALLQAFVAVHLPLEHIGGVDLAGGLLLGVALAGFGLPTGRRAGTALTAAFLLVAIDPQVVNISALFTGVVLIMAVTYLTGRETDPAPLLGLLYAGLIALKTTFAVFVAVHFVSTTLAAWGLTGRRPQSRWQTVAWTLLFLAPWLALHAPLYFAAAGVTMPAVAAAVPEAPDLFSRAELFYGSRQILYTGLAVFGAALALGGGIIAWRRPAARTAPLAAAIAAGLTAGLVYVILVVGLGPVMFGGEASTRYALPVLLGTLPVALRLLDLMEGDTARRFRFLAVGGGLTLAFCFTPGLAHRLRQITAERSPLAFFHHYDAQFKADYLEYNRDVLHGPGRDRVAQIQALVPAGETMVVWIMTPFWLDFRRNAIWHTDPYGLAMPWASWPAGTRYFLLQHRGLAVRPDHEYESLKASPGGTDRMAEARVRAFFHELNSRQRREHIIHQDELFVLIRLPAP